MERNINEIVKDIQLFMIAQFFDVMDVLESYEKIEDVKQDIKNRKLIYLEDIKKMSNSKDFLSLELYEETINKKIENCSEIYSTSIAYKSKLKKLEKNYDSFSKELEENNRNRLDEIKRLIYELCNFDTLLAYKIGLVDGMKLKNKCT